MTNYINSKTKVKIICPIHGIFEQVSFNHLNGSGCPKCQGRNKTTKEFIKESKNIHGYKYNYSLTNYINSKTKVKIICPGHGVFEQLPYDHIQMQGCPKCKSSKGEMIIEKILQDSNIVYEFQKKFKNCKNKRMLPFDFYLPKYNLCIEYDGEQHFKPIKFFGGEKGFKQRQKNDKIKTQYCKNNNIELLRIKYDKDIGKSMDLICSIYH